MCPPPHDSAAPPAPPAENTGFQAAVLSIVAGYADTLGFLSFGAFAGLMTGNTVLLGTALIGGAPLRALHTLAIIAAFLAGVGASARLRGMGWSLARLLVPEALALAAASFLPPAAAAPALAFGMGLQNAAATRFAGTTLNTVFLTGDLQKLTLAVVGRFGAGRPPPAAAAPRVGVLALVYAGYFAGVLLGATAHALAARPLLLAIPVLPLALVPLGARQRARPTPPPGTQPPG